MADIEGDAVKMTHQSQILSLKDYGDVLAKLFGSFTEKDVQKIKFLCFEFISNKNVLAKQDLSARDIFIEMNRNGSLSPKNVGILSQITNLIGNQRLQREVLTSRGVPAWKPGMNSHINNFRLLLFNLNSHIRPKQDLPTLKDCCSFRGFLSVADTEQITDALVLFTELINKDVIAEYNIEPLKDLIGKVDNIKMNTMVESFVAKRPEYKPKGIQPSTGLSKPFEVLTITDKPIPSHSPLGSAGKNDNLHMSETGCGLSLRPPSDFKMEKTNNSSFQTESYKDNLRERAVAEGACGGSESKEAKEQDTETVIDTNTISLNPSNLDVHPGKSTTAKLRDVKKAGVQSAGLPGSKPNHSEVSHPGDMNI